MLKYMLFFAAGYYLGSGGKLPPRPEVSVGPDGSLLIKPPEANPSTAPLPTPQPAQQVVGYGPDGTPIYGQVL